MSSRSVVEGVVAGTALLLLAPILALTSAIIWILSRRPPLVAHRRVGRDGAVFWMLKFRSMWNGHATPAPGFIERLNGDEVPEKKNGDDPRVTSRFARLCRKYSIDELPQLWHVVRGEMSLVGPRPVTRAEWERHYGSEAIEVLRVKPGISGLWQVRGRNRLTYRQRRRLDLFLVRHFTPGMYLSILMRTVPRALSGRDAW